MNKIKFGIIGLGDIGRGHLKCLLSCQEASVVGICDTEPKRLEQVGFFGIQKKDIEGIPFVTDYRKLLENKEIDAIVVCVPSYLHKEATIAALEAGKHVLLEKPLAHTLHDADAIVKASKKSQKKVQIGLVYRYSPFYRKMFQVVQSGIIGSVQMMWCKEYRQPFPQVDWFYDEKKSGGAIVEKNTHHFDIFSWMIGSKPVRVAAFGGQNVIKKGVDYLVQCSYCTEPPKIINNSSIIDNGFIIIEYENGARASLGLCMFVKPFSNSQSLLDMGAIGSRGLELMSNSETGRLEVCSGIKEEQIDYSMKIEGTEFGHNGALEEHLEFIECIKNNKEPIANIEKAYEALLVALAAKQSIKEKRIIDLD